MLKQRVITAVVLLCILLPALFYKTATPFIGVALVLIAAGGWEWGKLNQCSAPVSVALGAVTALVCSASWYLGWPGQSLSSVWLAAGALWVLAGALMLRQGVEGWKKIPSGARIVAGLVVLWLAWLAVAQARVVSINFLLSVLALVWVADISAYFAGRAFGGRFSRGKLAPSISPGKSWEGVWGGMVGVLIMATVWVALDRATFVVPGTELANASLYTRVWGRHGALVLALACLFLAAMSVVGDLVESLVKRSAGAKDSSGLLPGHGGVLDRIDALLPVVPLAMMLASL